jgi:DnaJ-class molecular chaperone
LANSMKIDEARKVVELSEAATLKEIKRAYRTPAYRHHPDKHSGAAGEETEETMKRLNWAYKLLMDYCGNYKYSFREEDVTRTYPPTSISGGITIAGLRASSKYNAIF